MNTSADSEEEEEEEDEDDDVEDEEEDDMEEDEEDEDEDEEDEQGSDDDEEDEDDEDDESDLDSEEEIIEKPIKSTKKSSKSINSNANTVTSEFGVSRGIDFQNVAFVINFDFPLSNASYTHRIGRTARCGAAGTALSFVSVTANTTDGAQSNQAKHLMKESDIADRDAKVLAAIQAAQPKTRDANAMPGHAEMIAQPSPLLFNTKELESFRYRVYDVLRSVTSAAVKELRTAEIKRELLNSEKLKSFFQENPNDLKVLRHDKAVLHPIRQLDHLKAVPEYLIPVSMRSIVTPHAGSRGKNKRKKLSESHTNAEQKMKQSKSKDPLYGGVDEPEVDMNVNTATESTDYEENTCIFIVNVFYW